MVIVRQMQAKSEALFVENKTLQQEVRRLSALHPVIGFMPDPPSKLTRMGMRVLPKWRQSYHLKLLRHCGLFDPRWYLATYPDVAKTKIDPALHFLTRGAAEQRNPGPHFDTAHYMRMYPDIAERGLNPLVHYLQSGWREGRAIRPGMRHGDSPFGEAS